MKAMYGKLFATLLLAVCNVTLVAASEPGKLQVGGSKEAVGGPVLATRKRLCKDLIMSGELEPDFPGIIAHTTHSMNQEALEYLFDANTPEDNGVPVVNPNLTSHIPILGSAPRLGVNMTFQTFAMNQLDWILSHMNDERYDMGSYGALERIMHQMHMIEVWSEAAKLYEGLKSSPPPSKFCACVTDVEANGVIKLLRFIALQIREPELMLGHHTTINGRPAKWDGNVYSYAFFSGEAAYGDVLNQTEVLPTLQSAQAWQVWKELMASMKGRGGLTAAKYLYCTLNSSFEAGVVQGAS